MNQQQGRTFSRNMVGAPSAFLAERIRQDSNLELEWLWAAEQVTDMSEKRYCLERALYINPDNDETRRALRNLAPRRNQPHSSASLEEPRSVLLPS